MRSKLLSNGASPLSPSPTRNPDKKFSQFVKGNPRFFLKSTNSFKLQEGSNKKHRHVLSTLGQDLLGKISILHQTRFSHTQSNNLLYKDQIYCDQQYNKSSSIQHKSKKGQPLCFSSQALVNPILCPDQSLIHISKYPTKKGLDNFLNSTGNFFRPQSPPHKELTMKYLGKVQALNKSQWCSPNEVANVFEEFFTDLTYHLPEYEQIFKVMKGLAATLKKTQPLHGQKASLNLNFKPVKEKRCLQALASQPLSIKSMTKTTHSNKTDTHLKDKARKVPPLNLRKITEINPKECEEESLEQVDVSDDSWKREVEDMKTFLSECQQIIVYVKNIEVKVYDIIPLYVYVAMIVLCLILGNVYYWV
eukprot:TRINITY_DN1574_c0_g1_i2.p1 TRINITY_DN1574_c0_g1~~TRINITY_DN1574_c0_g1_i2.p1  ORF type:complete len:425 (-),score=13.56 TRINITY_DN1574_c0_g1_i2:128-1213(-)